MRTTNHASLPLTVFYDGACRLCSAEIGGLRRIDHRQALHMVDCSGADFDDGPWRAEGVTRAAMLGAMHVRDARGAWFIGIDAFEAMYAAVGVVAMARAWTHPLLRPLNERLYPRIVRHRQRLSALGAHRLVDAAWRLALRRRAQRAVQTRRCDRRAGCDNSASLD